MVQVRNLTFFADWICACGARVDARESHGVEQGCDAPRKLFPKEWLRRKYSDKAELFEALLRLFNNQVTDEMVFDEFKEEVE